MIRLVSVVLVASAMAGGAACRKTSGTAPGKPADQAAAKGKAAASGLPGQPPTPLAPKPVPAQLPDVLARVNGEPVTKVDFDRLIKNIEMSEGRPVPADRRDEILRKALDQLVAHTVLAQETKARNVTVPDTEIEANLKQMQSQFPNDQEFQKALAARGMTVEKLRADARVDIGINKMIEAEVATVPGPSEAEAREFYDKNPDKFRPEEVRASHILVAVPQNADEATIKKAQAKADIVLQQARAGGDFAALARKYSDDSSKQKGGDLDFFRRGKLVPEFEEAAFSLQPGQMSGIVASQFGFHIIKVTDRRIAPLLPFDQVSRDVREGLFVQHRQERQEAFVEGLKKKAKIEVLI